MAEFGFDVLYSTLGVPAATGRRAVTEADRREARRYATPKGARDLLTRWTDICPSDVFIHGWAVEDVMREAGRIANGTRTVVRDGMPIAGHIATRAVCIANANVERHNRESA